MSELADIIEANIEKYDALREVFFPDGVTCYLLAGDGELAAYSVKAQLGSGWYLKYSSFRGRFELFYATLDQTFAELLTLCGYAAISGEVYRIDESETVQLQGNRASWRIACERTGGKKFTPPDTDVLDF